ncbi:eukaryotic translation initiation factor 4 gamma 2 [Lampetra fluviatilis]
MAPPFPVAAREFLGSPGTSIQRWVPSRSTKREVNTSATPDRNEAIFRKVRGILNKLTPEKFDKLCLELLNVGIDSKLILKGIILLIFEKALEEPKYSSLYSQLCQRLAEDAPNFDGPPLEGPGRHKHNSSFRRLLIAKLQDEFENRTKKLEGFDNRDSPLSPEEDEQRTIAKLKMLGNIKFIGELGKLDLLHESILHRCIKTLLEKKKRVALKDMAEDLECLCQIMRTVGPRLDHDKARSLMDQYFLRMQSLMANKDLPARIRFLLQDTVELRLNKWVPRKAFSDNGPKPISQIRQDAIKDLGVFIPSQLHGIGRSEFFQDDPFAPWGAAAMGRKGLERDPRDPLGGLSEMFGQMPGRELGTGPGVIQSRFSPPSARHRPGPMYNGFTGPGGVLPAYGLDPGKLAYSRAHQGALQQQQGFLAGPMGAGFFGPPGGVGPGGQGFKKGPVNADEISLRPAQSFSLLRGQGSKLQAQIPTMMPPSTQPPRTLTPPLGPPPTLGLKSAPPPIQEKPAKKEKKVPTKEELLKQTETIVLEVLGTGSLETGATAMQELRAPRPMLPDLVSHVMALTLERSDEDREKAAALLSAMKQQHDLVTPDIFVKAWCILLERCAELETDVPLVKSSAAGLVARAVAGGLVGLAELAQPLENGAHFPLFLLCLQQLSRLVSRDELAELFQSSRINMQKMLPECDQSKERMLEILEGKGLSYLFPLLHLEKELSKQIEQDPSPQAIYKWIKENVPARLHTDSSFVNILTVSFLQYVTRATTLAPGLDPSVAPVRDVMEAEKQLLASFKPVLQKFLHSQTSLQVAALYALQVHCHTQSFPKGMLLRFFMNLYDLEIIEEEAFMAWKEDVTEEFPGKGKALFQVNQWLTWLETAEEDESEDDDAD